MNRDHYRLDIQGLRAIALLAVVVFHINPTLLPGGYLGVDLFFVISGYLILGFIWRDLAEHRFSLMVFYTKRIYRLFPAMLVMVIVTTVAAYYLLLPQESMVYLKSLLSTLFYFSNFYFYTESNYFNDAMAFYPLLHTWSLSVEEQFYMLFPLVLMWIYAKQKRHIMRWLLLIALCSLALSQWYVIRDPSLAFFASPTRFFQFMIGGMIAIVLQRHLPSRDFADFGTLLGLLLIAVSLWLYSEQTPFPGIAALLPSLGIGLVLYFGSSARYSHYLLENRVMATIGNASYSIYLWHWPLIVFYKLKISPNLSFAEQWMLLGISLLIGILSWKYIEDRFRKEKVPKVSWRPFVKMLVLSSVVTVSGFILFTYFPYEKSHRSKQVVDYLEYDTSHFRDGKCFLTSRYNDVKFYDKQGCVTHDATKKNYLLIGDSHAAHYYSALNELLKEGETLTQVTSSGCVPMIPFQGIPRCTALMNWAFYDLLPQKHFDVVILSGHWGYIRHDNIVKTIDYLQRYTDKIIIFGPSLQYSQPLPRLLAGLQKDEKSTLLYKSAGKYEPLKQIDTALQSYFTMDKVEYISMLDLLCSQDECESLTPGGVPINFDESHLTHQGALYLLNKVRDRIFPREE